MFSCKKLDSGRWENIMEMCGWDGGEGVSLTLEESQTLLLLLLFQR